MKKILSFIGIAALLAMVSVVNVSAQIAPAYGYAPIAGIAPTLAAGTTNYPAATAPVIGSLRWRYIGFAFTLTSASPGATNTYKLAPSIDGINFDTNTADIYSVTAYCVGSGPVTLVTNWDSYGTGYYKLISITTVGTATNGITATNGAVSQGANYSIKILP